MTYWPLKTAIATLWVVGIAIGVQAQEEIPAQEVDQLAPTSTQLEYEDVGLRIKQSNIVKSFAAHLTRYVGDCPGEGWSGSATQDNVRFISYANPPAKDLRVELVNLTSGDSLKKKYTKSGFGSHDFKVTSLGENAGSQKIQYTIFNQDTDAILEQGSFDYELITSYRTMQRDGQWRAELFCGSDRTQDKNLKDCAFVGSRQRLYCQGAKTDLVRNEYISPRRNKRW